MSRTALYRHFDADGVLLYVGISNSVTSRTGDHITYSPWATRIENIRVEFFDTRDEACAAEARAIISERPQFNKMHAVSESGQAITDLISHWETRKALALEIGASNVAVHRWAERNRLPAEWQQSVIEAAHRRGMTWVTAAWLVSVQAKDPKSGGAA